MEVNSHGIYFLFFNALEQINNVSCKREKFQPAMAFGRNVWASQLKMNALEFGS